MKIQGFLQTATAWFLISGLGMDSLGNEGNPCANSATEGPSGLPKSGAPCDEDGTNVFSAYSGNARRMVLDLKLFGSVGRLPLQFARYSNTRMAPQSQNMGRFGRESPWSHNHQWFMRDGGTWSNGQPVIRIGMPDGGDAYFVQDQNDSNLWVPPANSDKVLRQAGAQFGLHTKDGTIYRFQRRTNTVSGGVFYRLESAEDVDGNIYTYGYNSVNDTLLRQVTDPSGRWLRLIYNNIGGFAQQRVKLGQSPAETPAGQWHEVNVTNTGAYRFLTLYSENDFGNDPALPVSEIEFYDENNQLISGAPIGSDPYFAAEHSAEKAFDGNETTYYRYAYMRNGYVGLDLGANGAKRVSKIRYFIPAGVVAASKVTRAGFYGLNELNSANQAVKEVRASDGRTVVYNYSVFDDPSGWFRWATLQSCTYPDSSVANYGYVQVHDFTRPMLAVCSDPRYSGAGGEIAYEYDGDTALGFIRKEKNGITGDIIAETAHDSAHKPKAVYPNGKVVKYQYGSLNANMTSRADGLNRVWNYEFGNLGAGHLVKVVDPMGRTTEYERSSLGNVTREMFPDLSTRFVTRDQRERVMSVSVGGPGITVRTTGYLRDSLGRLTRVNHPDGTFETWTYNGFGQALTHRRRNGGVETSTYSVSGLMMSFADAGGNVTNYSYNSKDQIVGVTDALGRVTTYSYNDLGQVTQVGFADGTSQAFDYDDAGNLIAQTNEAGQTWVTTYDAFRRVSSQTDPLGRMTTYAYDTNVAGCGACNTGPKPTYVTLPSGKQVRYGYDAEWRLTSVTQAPSQAEMATTSLQYDLADNLVRVIAPDGAVTNHVYNNRDRRIQTTDPLNRKSEWTYDVLGNVLTEKRPDNGVTVKTYDVMNRVLTTRDPKNQVTSFAYGSEGNLISLTDARGHSYGYVVDLLNRTVRKNYPDGSHEAWTYNGVHHRLTSRVRSGAVATSSFDARNREVGVNWSDATPDVTRVFDATGRLVSASNGLSTSSYSYNVANEMVSETQHLQGVAAGLPSYTVGYTWDLDGNKASVTYPGGSVVNLTYTQRNEIATISEGGPPPLVSYSYFRDGARATKVLENGVTTGYTYDLANQLLGVSHSVGGVPLQSRNYLYNSVGNRSAMQVNGANWDVYWFDAVDQVTSVKYQADRSSGTNAQRTVGYDWDAVGNREQVQESTPSGPVLTDVYATANAVNQYRTINGSTVTHDGNGNLTAAKLNVGAGAPVATLGYDSQNRLLSVQNGSDTVQSTYDTRNRLTSRTINGVKTLFLWDGWDLIEERDVTGAQVRRYVHGAAVDEILVMVDGQGAKYHVHDALGSVTGLVDDNGAVVESYLYDVFGQVAVFDGSGVLQTGTGGTASGNRFLYTGREWVAEAGLYDYRNRVYSPKLGRFMQVDPIRFWAGDVNLYRYVGNGVVVLVDPDGRWAWLNNLGGVFVGAAVGYNDGIAYEVTRQWAAGEQANGQEVLNNGINGAWAGGVAGGILGAGAVMSSAPLTLVASVLGGLGRGLMQRFGMDPLSPDPEEPEEDEEDRKDQDGDGVPDNEDPDPNDPGVPGAGGGVCKLK
jgi:RHS repeat-associated protein